MSNLIGSSNSESASPRFRAKCARPTDFVEKVGSGNKTKCKTEVIGSPLIGIKGLI